MVYKFKLRTDEFSTNHLQFYNSMAEIMVAAFGSKDNKTNTKKLNDMAPEEAVKSLNDLFQMAGNF